MVSLDWTSPGWRRGLMCNRTGEKRSRGEKGATVALGGLYRAHDNLGQWEGVWLWGC
jgi:hypothetical protein